LSAMNCEKCGRGELVRTGRTSVLERHLYSRFGFYPWVCTICRKVTVLRDRGERRKSKRTPESEREFSRKHPRV
jgi:hypothetical protein